MQNIFKIYFILVIKLNRPDRDENIEVVDHNIESSWKNQFRKLRKDEFHDLGTPYDFQSIMVCE
jgi:hypothetical protein